MMNAIQVDAKPRKRRDRGHARSTSASAPARDSGEEEEIVPVSLLGAAHITGQSSPNLPHMGAVVHESLTPPPRGSSESERDYRARLREKDRLVALQARQNAERQSREEAERRERERSVLTVQKEWTDEVLPHWHDSPAILRRARELAWRGIPPSQRGRVWPLALGNRLRVTSSLYRHMVARASAVHTALVARAQQPDYSLPPSPPTSSSASPIDPLMVDCTPRGGSSIGVIALDLPRTFPALSFFQERGPLHGALQNVLAAYAMYRPDVGYVQGMSYLAAMLLLYVPEELAFCCLANLLHNCCLLTFYRLQVHELDRLTAVIDEMARECVPHVFAHLRSIGVPTGLFVVDWVLTLFSKSLSVDIASRLWDVFVFEGDFFLFRTIVGVLCYFEDTLSREPFDVCLSLLTHLPDDISEKKLLQIVQLRVNVPEARFRALIDAAMPDPLLDPCLKG